MAHAAGQERHRPRLIEGHAGGAVLVHAIGPLPGAFERVHEGLLDALNLPANPQRTQLEAETPGPGHLPPPPISHGGGHAVAIREPERSGGGMVVQADQREGPKWTGTDLSRVRRLTAHAIERSLYRVHAALDLRVVGRAAQLQQGPNPPGHLLQRLVAERLVQHVLGLLIGQQPVDLLCQQLLVALDLASEDETPDLCSFEAAVVIYPFHRVVPEAVLELGV